MNELNNKIIKKESKIIALQDIPSAASLISRDVSVYLSEEIEDLKVNSFSFKHSLELCLIRLLSHMKEKDSSIAIFPDSVPGFTAMSFKVGAQIDSNEINPVEILDLKNINDTIVSSVIDKHFEKSDKQILYIETTDLILILFPLNETKAHLKEVGLYIV